MPQNMKIRFTPYLIVSLSLILLGLIYILSGTGGNLGPLVGMLIIAVGLLFLILHFISRKANQKKSRWKVIIQLLVLTVLALFYFKFSEKIVLHIPKNFYGYVYLIYGVENKPKLQTNNFLSSNIDLTVPSSGIIFTSDKPTRNTVIIDSSHGEVKKIYPGHGIPTAGDTLRCGNKKYYIDVFVIGNFSTHWDYSTDTLKRNLKKELACKMLGK